MAAFFSTLFECSLGMSLLSMSTTPMQLCPQAINAAPPMGRAAINAAPRVALAPTQDGRQPGSGRLFWTKMPVFHWRHLGAAVGEVVPVGRQPSPRVVAAELVHDRRRVPIHVWTDDGGSQSQAKAQVCLVECMLHALHHGAVPLLAGAQFTRNRWSVKHIWDEVCRLQLQMHGFAYVGAAP
jgi:hypothetical protein